MVRSWCIATVHGLELDWGVLVSYISLDLVRTLFISFSRDRLNAAELIHHESS